MIALIAGLVCQILVFRAVGRAYIKSGKFTGMVVLSRRLWVSNSGLMARLVLGDGRVLWEATHRVRRALFRRIPFGLLLSYFAIPTLCRV